MTSCVELTAAKIQRLCGYIYWNKILLKIFVLKEFSSLDIIAYISILNAISSRSCTNNYADEKDRFYWDQEKGREQIKHSGAQFFPSVML